MYTAMSLFWLLCCHQFVDLFYIEVNTEGERQSRWVTAGEWTEMGLDVGWTMCWLALKLLRLICLNSTAISTLSVLHWRVDKESAAFWENHAPGLHVQIALVSTGFGICTGIMVPNLATSLWRQDFSSFRGVGRDGLAVSTCFQYLCFPWLQLCT